ncbi:hypothetical protein [Actinotalea sp.]|uniref:hypothetical protein n=1 Tax=Actinotalea sp. TaxID=1872145 RepID=UPI003569B44E
MVAASLLRRWYLVVAGMVMTTGLAFLAFQAVPPTYSATATIVLLPADATVADGSNPLLQLGGLEQPASLVVAYVAGDEVRAPFEAQFPETTYEVIEDPLSRGPLIIMTVLGPSSTTVMTALDAAIAEVPTALTSLQDRVSAPTESRVRSTPLSIDPEPTTVMGTTLRAIIAAAGVGMVGTLVGTVSLDRLLSLRRTRRPTRPVEPESENGAADDTESGTPEEASAAAPAEEDASAAPAEESDASAAPAEVERSGDTESDQGDATVGSDDEELSIARSTSDDGPSASATPPSGQSRMRSGRRRTDARPTQDERMRERGGRLIVPWA